MPPRYQSIRRWDDLIQSAVQEIAISPLSSRSLWETKTGTTRAVEDFNPPSVKIGGKNIAIPSPLQTVQTDVLLDRALILRVTEKYLLAYRIFPGAQESVVTLIHASPLISSCDVRIGDIDGATVVFKPETPTKLCARKVTNLSSVINGRVNEDLLDHEGQEIENLSVFSSNEPENSFVVTTSKSSQPVSPWIRLELWRRIDSDSPPPNKSNTDEVTRIFYLPARLFEAIQEHNGALSQTTTSYKRWLKLRLPLITYTEIALALGLAWMVWLLGTISTEPTDLIERTSKQVVADGSRAIIVGACRWVVCVVDACLHAIQALFQVVGHSLHRLWRLLVVFVQGA